MRSVRHRLSHIPYPLAVQRRSSHHHRCPGVRLLASLGTLSHARCLAGRTSKPCSSPTLAGNEDHRPRPLAPGPPLTVPRPAAPDPFPCLLISCPVAAEPLPQTRCFVPRTPDPCQPLLPPLAPTPCPVPPCPWFRGPFGIYCNGPTPCPVSSCPAPAACPPTSWGAAASCWRQSAAPAPGCGASTAPLRGRPSQGVGWC